MCCSQKNVLISSDRDMYILLHHHDRSPLCICEPLLIESLTQLIHFQRSSTCQFHRNLRHLFLSASSLSFFTATSLKRRALKGNWISWEILGWKRYHHLWNLAQIFRPWAVWVCLQIENCSSVQVLWRCISKNADLNGVGLVENPAAQKGDQEILNPSTPQVPILTSIFELSLLWLRFFLHHIVEAVVCCTAAGERSTDLQLWLRRSFTYLLNTRV